ncbi:MAG: hypothetical protein RLZ12_325 [Bacillota bacterium]
MYANVTSATLLGINSYLVEVEVDINGRRLPGFDLVGLPDSAVREARGRVRAAITNSNFKFPIQRITTNLAPADIRKEGSGFDLAIALGILIASSQLQPLVKKTLFLGELALEGRLRPLPGVLSMVQEAKINGFQEIFVPAANKSEASLVSGINVYAVHNLKQVIDHILGDKLKPLTYVPPALSSQTKYSFDFQDVKGQLQAKRALEIAAAGRHNLIFIGPPGSGKSMLAKRLLTILPVLRLDEALEVVKIYSAANVYKPKEAQQLTVKRPFRAPHHTTSTAGLTGGGSVPKPGEISLAHCGILFLDELPEFSKQTLEGLRQPLEENQMTICRAKSSLTYPADIILICAMNPCPCGFYGYETTKQRCSCSSLQRKRYRARISGPLLDRIDLHIEVPPVNYQILSCESVGEKSSLIARRVLKAQARQFKRTNKVNSRLTIQDLAKHCVLNDESTELMQLSFEKLNLSARAYNRILKVARTIADLEDSNEISAKHIAEAIQYRTLDKAIIE